MCFGQSAVTANSPYDLQARARGFTAIENGEISILAAFQNKILEQKVMVGKVIDTCQSRLLSWSLSSSQLIQTAKESSAPLRTCPNHPNGCPVPGAAAQQQPASPAAIQAQPQATNNAAVQAQPPASSAAVVQAQPQVTAATAAAANGRAASRQVAQPVTSTAAAEATRTEHLQARDNKQKQLDAQYHALQAQQAAQEAAAHQGQTGNRPGAASSSNDSGESTPA